MADDLTTYRGGVNEDGLEWHGDLEQYIPNHWENLMRVDPVTGDIFHVLIGTGNVKVPEGEWKAARDRFGDDKKGLAAFLKKNYYKPPRAETVIREAILDFGDLHEWEFAKKIVDELGKHGYTVLYNEESDEFRGFTKEGK